MKYVAYLLLANCLFIFNINNCQAQPDYGHSSIVFPSPYQSKINALKGNGLFSSPPLIETWEGNQSIWYNRYGGQLEVDRYNDGPFGLSLNVYNPNDKLNLVGLWGAMIGFTGQKYLAPDDERLVFEAMIYLDTNNGGRDRSVFMGLLQNTSTHIPADSLTYIDSRSSYRRFGFAMDDTSRTALRSRIRGLSASGVSVARTRQSDIRENTWVYLKMVYDFDNSITFYVNDKMIDDPLLGGLPSGDYEMMPVFSIKAPSVSPNSQWNLRVGEIRCYFQNGG